MPELICNMVSLVNSRHPEVYVFNKSDQLTMVILCGFYIWKLICYWLKDVNVIDLTSDEHLPQWFIPDPAHPLKISTL